MPPPRLSHLCRLLSHSAAGRSNRTTGRAISTTYATMAADVGLTPASIPDEPDMWGDLKTSIKRNKSERTSGWVQLATVKADGRPANRTIVHRQICTLDGSPHPVMSFVTDRRSEKCTEIQHSDFAEVVMYLPITREQYRISGRLTIYAAGDELLGYDGGWSRQALESERLQAFERMSDAGRSAFAWPDPGAPRVDPNGAFVSALPLSTPAFAQSPSAATDAADGSADVTGVQAEAEEHIFDRAAAGRSGDTLSRSHKSPPPVQQLGALVQRAQRNFALLLLSPDSVDCLCLKYAPTQQRTKYSLTTEGKWTAIAVNP